MHMEIKVTAMRVNIVPKLLIGVQKSTELIIQSWYHGRIKNTATL